MKNRIMFVCHGNICRSPMAEFIMKSLAADKGISDDFIIESSATSTEEIWNGVGSPFYAPARAELSRHGIPYTDRRAVLLSPEDYNKFDLFIGMDSANIRNMHRIFGSDPDGKIRKLLDFSGDGRDVSDPWYSRRFDIAYDDIYKGCKALITYCEKNLKNKMHLF